MESVILYSYCTNLPHLIYIMHLIEDSICHVTCNLYTLVYFQIFIILTFQTIWPCAAVRSARAQEAIFLLKLFSVKNCYPLK